MNEVINNRFCSLFDNESIRHRITVRPQAIGSLNNLHPAVGAEILANHLRQIYLPNDFSMEFIESMLGLASLHFAKIFQSEVHNQSLIYTPPPAEVLPICLTGLAGVGKSFLINALRKVMPSPAEYCSQHFDGSITLVSYWYASAREKISGKSLLKEFLSDPPWSGNKKRFLDEARKRAFRDGVSLILLDETQFINTGLATASITDILLTLASIGPPAVFVSNYSLVHKLFGRNSEDQQRLLAQPRVMVPDLPGGKDWTDYVEECVRVSNGVIRPGRGDFAGELYRCTFGIKRLAVHLLTQAYIECRKDGRFCIELQDLTSAFGSTEFTSNAGEVEELHRYSLGTRQSGLRLDLKCPFDLPNIYKTNIGEFVKAGRDQRVIEKVFESSLTEAEMAANKHLKQASGEVIKRKPKRPAASPIPKEEQAEAFRSYFKSPR
ncbi:AAA family ATPase [Pseudomonas putida]